PVIVDIRSSIAYRMGHIDGAINLPIESFEKLIDSNSPFPKEKPVLLACAVGEKTTRHAAYLQSREYRAYSVEGGMMALKAMKQQAKAA
ncbi:MAG TPA: rhodanese-like domain-containing protein, partial [Micavibrio sp.]|nr:rhodanese-like domain-containing protein [Micavibrio sp.]